MSTVSPHFYYLLSKTFRYKERLGYTVCVRRGLYPLTMMRPKGAKTIKSNRSLELFQCLDGVRTKEVNTVDGYFYIER